jgi:hypothetical protein
MNIPVWAGVIPLTMQVGTPQPETGNASYSQPNLPIALAAERT